MKSSASVPVVYDETPVAEKNPGEKLIDSESLLEKNLTTNNNNNMYLGEAEKINIENDRRKYFAGLKTNLQADMETFKELIGALAYMIYGIFVSFVLTFIPRRFRYKNISGQIVLVTGAGSGIGKMMAKKLALNHGATIVAWDINKTGKTC